MSASHCLQGLKTIRKLRRVKGSELADLIGLKPTSYSRFERGERRIYLDQAIVIARRLGVRVDDMTQLLDEATAIHLCDQRDKAAIVAGKLGHGLWSPITGGQILAVGETVPPPPMTDSSLWTPGAAQAAIVPPPPPEPVAEPEQIAAVPPPPPPVKVEEQVRDLMEGWDGAS